MVARIRPEVKIPLGFIVLWSLARCTVGSYLNVEFPHLPILFRDADRDFWIPVKRKDIGSGDRYISAEIERGRDAR